MKLSKLMTAKGLVFLLIFSLLTFIGDKVNFSVLVGAENQFFTLFQFFGPVAGAFLGPVVGVLSVLIAELSSHIMLGKAFTLVNIVRLTPMLFAAWYFGTKKDKLSFLVPIAAMVAFIVHPIGRQVWFFTLYWTIPVMVKLLPKKYGEKVFLRSLGATFTAHAVGGAAWIWTVPMEAGQWIGLIPVVAYERLLFAFGITVSYIAVNTVLSRLDTKTKSEYLNINKKYVWLKHLS